jgi:CRP-like cAMP-binding protein
MRMAQPTKVLDRQFVPAGTLVIKQGTLGNRAFLIESGKVEVFATDAEGHEIKIAELGPQSIIGEMAVISGDPRIASVRTLEDSVLIALSAHEIQESARSAKGVFRHLIDMASNRMRDTRRKLMRKEKPAPKAAEPPPSTIALHISQAEQNGVKLERKTVPAGTLVIEQGTRETLAFLVESGKVEVFIKDAGGREIRIAELGPKSVIGEMAAITNEPRSASVRALEETVLIPIPAGALKEGMSKSAALHQGLMQMIVKRVKDTQRKLLGK